VAAATAHPEPSGRLLFADGTVVTADPGRPRARAVAVDGGRIVALDDDALAVTVDERISLAGRALVPGFRDGHIHPLWGGVQQLGVPVADAADVDEVLLRVDRFAREHADLPWIIGSGYPPEILPGATGDADVLDRAVVDRPVALWASDHHTMWVNSAALTAAGIDAATPDPPRGEIARRADGSPIGTLLEAATDLVERHLPATSTEDKVRGLGLALRQMAAAGIVAAQEAALVPSDVAVYVDLAAAGHLTADIAIALRADPEEWRAQRPAFLAVQETGGAPGVRVGTVKLFVDGVIETGTGALLEPYADDLGSRGILNWTAADLADAVATFDADGFQVHLHAIGDAAVRMALDAVAEAQRRNGQRDRRPVVAHTQLVHPDDLDRFAALGVVANFEPLWAERSPLMINLTEPRLGPERSDLQYPIAAILRSGAPVSFGSDWPVSSLVPIEGIAVAVDHYLPSQRITLDEAIAAYTRGTAYQTFDDGRGVIAVGAVADLCLLGADITRMPSAELGQVPVEGTWAAGEATFRSAAR
jgi:predicted amidohydrolase YtcJ